MFSNHLFFLSQPPICFRRVRRCFRSSSPEDSIRLQIPKRHNLSLHEKRSKMSAIIIQPLKVNHRERKLHRQKLFLTVSSVYSLQDQPNEVKLKESVNLIWTHLLDNRQTWGRFVTVESCQDAGKRQCWQSNRKIDEWLWKNEHLRKSADPSGVCEHILFPFKNPTAHRGN